MKKYAFLLLAIIILCSLTYTNSSTSELIRRKIENAHIQPISAFSENIYCKTALPQFYQENGFQPAWGNAININQLIRSISDLSNDGLNPSDYHIDLIKEKVNLKQTKPSDLAELDLLLTDAYLLSMSHIQSGKVNPVSVDAEWFVTRREGNPVEQLKNALTSNTIEQSYKNALPKHDVYTGLKQSLKKYSQLGAVSWQPIATGITIKKGMSDVRVPEIRKRLSKLGDYTKILTSTTEYDQDLFEAVVKFQTRHGLNNEGEIGPLTISALNISVEDRINQVKVNLERWRWLPQEFGNYYIKVNIAGFELDVIKDKKIIATHKIIVGKPFRSTPVFNSKMTYLVLNPTWTVPPGIIKADVLPGVRKDVGYLNKKKLNVYEKGQLIDPSTIDWNSNRVGSFTYVQPPGPDNALGAVKFMFTNPYHVYLHDTPSRELFEKTERAFSSGCIRVHRPLDLAMLLLNDPVKWNEKTIDNIVKTKVTQTVNLIEQPNVYLLYWTAWADAGNNINFRKDIYERDQKVLTALLAKPIDIK